MTAVFLLHLLECEICFNIEWWIKGSACFVGSSGLSLPSDERTLTERKGCRNPMLLCAIRQGSQRKWIWQSGSLQVHLSSLTYVIFAKCLHQHAFPSACGACSCAQASEKHLRPHHVPNIQAWTLRLRQNPAKWWICQHLPGFDDKLSSNYCFILVVKTNQKARRWPPSVPKNGLWWIAVAFHLWKCKLFCY